MDNLEVKSVVARFSDTEQYKLATVPEDADSLDITYLDSGAEQTVRVSLSGGGGIDLPKATVRITNNVDTAEHLSVGYNLAEHGIEAGGATVSAHGTETITCYYFYTIDGEYILEPWSENYSINGSNLVNMTTDGYVYTITDPSLPASVDLAIVDE